MIQPENLRDWIANGEHSGLEFKRDTVRPEQIVKEYYKTYERRHADPTDSGSFAGRVRNGGI